MDRSTNERTSACNQMAAVYWSPSGNFLAVPENKHISIMNIRGECYFGSIVVKYIQVDHLIQFLRMKIKASSV